MAALFAAVNALMRLEGTPCPRYYKHMGSFWKKTMMILGFAALAGIFAPVAQGKAAQGKTILAFGDSLTAGYGLQRNEAFPAQLQARLQQAGVNVNIVNGGVSGDTTAGGLRRLPYMLKKQQPDYVILALGANDMLRGIDPSVTRQNLKGMLEILKQHKIPVLLAGMRAYSNGNPAVDRAYVAMYKSLAAEYGAVLYPFFLQGVAMRPELNLKDGVHPTAQGVAMMVEGILPSVAQLLGIAQKPAAKKQD